MRARRASLLIATAALGITVALTGCGSSNPAVTTSAGTTVVNGVTHVDVGTFATLVSDPTIVVVDVRTPAEFASGHLARAVNIDINGADFTPKLDALDKAKTYAVYCHSGNRSGQALARMEAAGFTHVADLTGGITAWAGDGKPVITG